MSLASSWIKVIFCHFKKENKDDIGQLFQNQLSLAKLQIIGIN